MRLVLLWCLALGAWCLPAVGAEPRLIVRSEFIYDKAPFPSCHASTITQTPEGFAAAWFGGTAEKNPDVGIWFSTALPGGDWTTPVEVANGVQEKGKRQPCWNPVLFRPKDGPLLLFYKVGPSPSRWWGMMLRSTDYGKTWSKPERLPEGFVGPIKNKPVQVADGSLLCPSSTEYSGWRVHMERTPDLGKSWTKTEALNSTKSFDAIQPTILMHPGNQLQALCRSKQGRISEIWSEDSGKTWGPMTATELPNPSSGIDAITLRDGRHLLVFNPTTRERTPLSIAISKDGKTWQTAFNLEDAPGEFSYPAVIQASDNLVHVTYTWKRERIKHIVIDPKNIKEKPVANAAK
ncbi:MAG TPA: sialidase family protein [Candidatus Binatia bacterium]|nr:sialidase family protein [Candidatus Binatia bacterium]